MKMIQGKARAFASRIQSQIVQRTLALRSVVEQRKLKSVSSLKNENLVVNLDAKILRAKFDKNDKAKAVNDKAAAVKSRIDMDMDEAKSHLDELEMELAAVSTEGDKANIEKKIDETKVNLDSLIEEKAHVESEHVKDIAQLQSKQKAIVAAAEAEKTRALKALRGEVAKQASPDQVAVETDPDVRELRKAMETMIEVNRKAVKNAQEAYEQCEAALKPAATQNAARLEELKKTTGKKLSDLRVEIQTLVGTIKQQREDEEAKLRDDLQAEVIAAQDKVKTLRNNCANMKRAVVVYQEFGENEEKQHTLKLQAARKIAQKKAAEKAKMANLEVKTQESTVIQPKATVKKTETLIAKLEATLEMKA